MKRETVQVYLDRSLTEPRRVVHPNRWHLRRCRFFVGLRNYGERWTRAISRPDFDGKHERISFKCFGYPPKRDLRTRSDGSFVVVDPLLVNQLQGHFRVDFVRQRKDKFIWLLCWAT